jgi:hypothetical protein
MIVITADFEVKVPPGKYWLCDPCYAVPSELWMDLLHSCKYFNLPVGVVKAKDGKDYSVLGFSTAYGDGGYYDQFGNEFCVDAGLIGLTPVELAKENPFGALLVEFTDETTCSCYEGVLKFGKHEINTGD